jgi:hypothetical protein
MTEEGSPAPAKRAGDNGFTPFEEQTLAIARRTYRLTMFGFWVALGAAVFVGVQVREMTNQTQILAGQSESASAGGLMDEMNTRKQLAIAQQQADAAQKSVGSLKSQLRVMKEQLEVTDRPWLKVEAASYTEDAGGPLRFDENGRGYLTFKLVLTNIGRSVATHVEVRAKSFAMPIFGGSEVVGGSDFRLPIEEQEKLCKAHADRKSEVGYAIFPGEPRTKVYTGVFETKHIMDLHGARQGKPILPYVVGCVSYRYATSSISHQTGFVYEVSGGNGRQAIFVGNTVPVDSLTFGPYVLSGEYAY